MGMGVDRNRVRQLITEIVEGLGYEFVELELKGGGKNSVLRIFIDKPEGISHKDCALVSEQVGVVLDVEDLIPYSYTLEVSSPGLDRRLLKDSDYIRFEGKLARIQTRIPLQHQKAFKGRLRGLREGKVQLEMAGRGILEIPVDLVTEARLEFDWSEEKARSKEE
jgi:ribosome maturation factor RimP